MGIKKDIKLLKKYSQEDAENEGKLTIFTKLASTKFALGAVREKLIRLAGERVIDILMHVPSDYELAKEVGGMHEIADEEHCCLELIVTKIPAFSYTAALSKRPVVICCKAVDGVDVKLMFFHAFPRMMEGFYVGRQLFCKGKLSIGGKGKLTMMHPKIISKSASSFVKFCRLNQLEEDGMDVTQMHFNEITPIYPMTEGLRHMSIVSVVQKILNSKLDLSEFDGVLEGLPTFKEALTHLHFPERIEDICCGSIYRKELEFAKVEIYKKMLDVMLKHLDLEHGIAIKGDKRLVRPLVKSLPFKLTEEQIQCVKDIFADQAKSSKMFRIIQGETGSGKTLIAIIACLNAIECGKKAIIMAPTALLARQHNETIRKFCKGLEVRSELITGDTPQRERRDILSRMKLGYVDILVGTHTLFQEKFDMPKQIGLIVIDEQHSFGIEQRMELVNKCAQADILMMSATPMKYTKTMVESSKIAVSYLTKRPSGRKQTVIRHINLEEKYDILIDWLIKKMDQGEKIFWVCPLINKSKRLNYMDVKTRYDELCKHVDKDKILLLHGKMKQEKKDEILQEFRDNHDKKILVATQVIEMGIDIPEANIMIIENSEKFGEAQLTQLMGRVGRGGRLGYCIMGSF